MGDREPMDPFDLEKELAGWRHRLRRNPVFLDEDLEELEAHLRDHVASMDDTPRLACARHPSQEGNYQ